VIANDLDGLTLLLALYLRRRVDLVEPPAGVAGRCWLFRGARQSRGYGAMRVGGVVTLAHRAVYAAYVGPIPDGLWLDHLCERKRCVNPAHLEPVTPRTNALRHHRGRLQEVSECPILSQTTAAE